MPITVPMNISPKAYTKHQRNLALRQGHRAVMVLSGDHHWCRQQAMALLEGEDQECWWLGDHPPPGIDGLAWSHAGTRLGMECDVLVIDAFGGFDAEGFGALSGTVRAGGLLLLLVPELEQWHRYADPLQQRFALFPYTADDLSGHFLQRLVRVIESESAAVILRQGEPWPEQPEAAAGEWQISGDAVYATAEQREAVTCIRRVAEGHSHRPLVLSADRGRGKSAALGLAAAQLLHQGMQRLVVTAPRIDAAAQVFAHAAALLPGCEVRRGRLFWQGGTLEFIPPDALLQAVHEAQLLLVDEAAAIPTPILEGLLQRYSRIVFATTIHGYEGTGRGFAIRFHKVLTERTPQWHSLHLSEPVRWAANDPLERLSFNALLLDAEPAAAEMVAGATVESCRFESVDTAQLANDERSLGELFGLLVLAHYRTSPNDLRQLLDGPQQSLFVLRHEGHVVATALVVLEGELEPTLAEEVYRGRRRVQGHLLPQSLANHAGFPEAAQQRAARVMRIAVHPALQGRGLGSMMLQQIEQVVRQQGCDYFGASFGATGPLLAFWTGQGLLPVRVGLSREASSGTHSVMVMKPLSDAGVDLFDAVRRRFAETLPELLAEPLAGLDDELAQRLLDASPPAVSEGIGAQDRRDLDSFAFGLRGYELCMPAIRKWVLQAMSDETLWRSLTATQRQLLLHKVVQRREWSTVVRETALSGRKQAVQCLREAIAGLLRPRDDSAD